MAKAKVNVYVQHKDTGEYKYFEAGDEIPKDYIVTNPKVLEGPDDEEPSEAVKAVETQTTGPAPFNYDAFNNDELREELERRGLAKSGNRDTMLSRLRESDAG